MVAHIRFALFDAIARRFVWFRQSDVHLRRFQVVWVLDVADCVLHKNGGEGGQSDFETSVGNHC